MPNFSVIQKPLSEQTGGRGSRKLKWTAEMQTAFEQLKIKIKEDLQLAFPDYGEQAQPLELYVDASASGAGACLSQRQNDEMKVIAYASTTFAAAQVNYSTIEKELSALRWGVKTFRPFLIGLEFIIHTDHQPLIYLNNMRLIDSRLARTLEDLADFNFEIRYTPGKENAAADCLSRLYNPDNVHLSETATFVPGRLPDGLYLCCEVSGGGDSLIDSLFIILSRVYKSQHPPINQIHLRELLADEILINPRRYNLTLTRSSRRALRLMRCVGQLPSVEFFFAFAYLYKCIVFMHFGGVQPIGYFPPGMEVNSGVPRIHLQCIAGIHYNPLYETPLYVSPTRFDHMRVDAPFSPSVEPDEGDFGNSCDIADVQAAGSPTLDLPPWCGRHDRTHATSAMIEVCGLLFCALFDTGAQISCVSRSLFNVLGSHLNTDAPFTITGLGSEGSPSLGVAEISVVLPQCYSFANHSFVVVEDGMMPFCAILGVDFISANNISLDFTNMRFRMDGRVMQGPVIAANVLATELRVGVLGVSRGNSNLPLRIKEVCIGTSSDHLNFGLNRDSEHNIVELKSLVTIDQIDIHQRKCRLLSSLKRRISSGESNWPNSLSRFKRYQNCLEIVDGAIVYRDPSGNLIYVVSFNLLVEILLVVHYRMAHLGRQKLIELVRQHIWHPSLSRVSSDITRSCDLCQRWKTAPIVAPPVQKITTSAPFELVAMDLVSLPSSSGYIGCLVVMDHNTKWLSAVGIRSKTSAAIASAFEYRILPHLPHCPSKVLTDNGPEFAGERFNSCLASYGIKHQYTTPNKPASNGLVERANRTLIELLRVQATSSRTWYEVLPRAIMIHNSTYHSALKQSPSEYIYSKQHSFTGNVLLPNEVAECWREGHPSFGSFSFDQLVLRKSVFRGRESTNKFSERFEGPYSVIKVNKNGVTYVLKHKTTAHEVRAHHSQLRPYHLPPAYIRNHPYFQELKAKPEDAFNSGEDDRCEDQLPHFKGENEYTYEIDSFSDCVDSSESDELEEINLTVLSRHAVSNERTPNPGVNLNYPCTCQYCMERKVEIVLPEETGNLPTISDNVALWDDINIPPRFRDFDLPFSTPALPENIGDVSDEISSILDGGDLVDLPSGEASVDQVVALPTTGEHHSVNMLESDVEFWDVVEGMVNTDDISEDVHTLSEQVVNLVEEGVRVLESILDISVPYSFGDFFHVGEIETLDFSLGFTEGAKLVVPDGHSQLGSAAKSRAMNVRVRTAEKRLSELRKLVSTRQKSARSIKQQHVRGLPSSEITPMATRSRGPARDLPHIMPRALEYSPKCKRRTVSES